MWLSGRPKNRPTDFTDALIHVWEEIPQETHPTVGPQHTQTWQVEHTDTWGSCTQKYAIFVLRKESLSVHQDPIIIITQTEK